MFIPFLIILKIALFLSGTLAQNWKQHVSRYILNTLKPPQVTLFLPNSEDEEFHNVNRIFKSVALNLPIMIVDTNSIEANDSLFEHHSFVYPRLTNMYVIVYPSKELIRSRDVSKVKSIIKFMADIAPRPTRPRCLLIIFGSSKVSQRSIELISLYAWSKKFLDFTTLVSRRVVDFSTLNHKLINETVTYHYYNPFLDQHFSAIYEADVQLLPSKLLDLHGYKLTVAATNNPPYVILERNETGYPILNFTGSNFRILRILRKAMNFTYDLVPSTFEYYSEGHNESLTFNMLIGEINFSMNHLFLGTSSSCLDQLERSVVTISEEYTALIPVILKKHVHYSKSHFLYVIIAVSMYVIFLAITYLMKFDKQIWSGAKILEILLNVNTRQPLRWPERFIFFSVTFMAFNFTIDVLSELTEIQFEPYDDVASNNITYMSKLGYTPVILEQFQDLKLENEVNDDLAFKAKLTILKTAEECSFRLNEGEKIVCFMTKPLAEPLIAENKKNNKDPKMKLIKPYLWSAWKTIVFEPGTPFLERFNTKLEQLRDFGLLQRFIYDVTYHDKSDKYKKKDVEDILSTQIINSSWLIYMLVTGFAIATVVLFFEIIIRKAWIK